MSEYQKATVKLGNLGLNISVSPDLVQTGQYRRLQNIRTLQEGQLTTRFGLIKADTEFNNLDLEDPVLQLRRVSTEALLLITESGKVYLEGQLLPGITLDDPTSVSVVRFNSADTGRSWTYLSSTSGMWRINNSTGAVYKWGITEPQGFPSVSLISPLLEPTTGNLDSSSANTIPYQWAYTYYSTITGAESYPSEPSDTLITDASGTAFLRDLVPSTDPQVDRYRIYRAGGTLGDYRLEDEIEMLPWEEHQWFQSVKSDDQISLNASLNFDVEVPFTSIGSDGEDIFETPVARTWGPFAGTIILATGDPYRPGYVYWTNTNNPDMTSTQNLLPVTAGAAEPLLNGFIFGANAFVWSRDNLYALDYGGPTAAVGFTARQVPLGIGLSAPDGFCLGLNGVYFISKDGIYQTDCQQSEPVSLTHNALRPIFLNQEVRGKSGEILFSPIDWTKEEEIRLTFTGHELHFTYLDAQGSRQHLVYDVQLQRWQEFVSALGDARYVYGDENSPQYKTLFCLNDGYVYQLDYVATDDAGLPIDCVVRLGSWDANEPLTMKEWGVLQVDSDCAGGTMTVAPLTDAESTELATWTITNSDRTLDSHSLYDTYARNLTFEFTWSGKQTLYQLVVLLRMDEPEIVHWEQPETSFGIGGWKHLRDGYFGMRTDAAVTLQVVIDGVVYTYTIPSTSGERRLIYQKFAPVKGKAYRVILDSTLPFRLYAEDTYLNIKPWQTGLSYTQARIGVS